MNFQNTKTQHHPLIILGSGPAGYTASIYLSRAGVKHIIISGNDLGGQLTKTAIVDNWPGDVDGVSGYELMERMQRHVARFAKNNIVFDSIVKVDLQQKPFVLFGINQQYTCDVLIIATGTSPRYLGLPAEERYVGHGVSTCATCDGYFYKNEKVVVVGGGNTALEDAMYLANIAEEVTLIHRRNSFRADAILIKELQSFVDKGKIKVMFDHVVEDIVGTTQKITTVKLKHIETQAITEIPASGVFVAVGVQPNTDLFVDQLKLKHGYVTINTGNSGNFTSTSIDGVFACGDVANPYYKQAITASAFGCMSAMDAIKYLNNLNFE